MEIESLFDLFEMEEERRYQEELKGEEPFSAIKNKYNQFKETLYGSKILARFF